MKREIEIKRGLSPIVMDAGNDNDVLFGEDGMDLVVVKSIVANDNEWRVAAWAV